MDSVVIIGAGQTGGQAAITLREAGFRGRVVLIGNEPHVPYARTPLSADVLSGQRTPESCFMHDAAFYAAYGVELRLGRRAVALDRAARTVRLDDGTALSYGALLLATGTSPKRLEVPGVDLPGVSPLRTLDQAAILRAGLTRARRVVVVGGGWVGLQAAASAHALGCQVTVIEREEHLLRRVAPPEVALIVRTFHATRGIRILCNVAASAFEASPDGTLAAVHTHDGRRLPADVAILAIGAVPDTRLALAAGLATEDGVLVDARGQTSDPAIYAAGDCTRFYCPPLGRTVRLESWRNARLQAVAVGRALAGDPHAAFADVPSLHSNQGPDLQVDIVGAPERWDQVMARGAPWVPSCTLAILDHDVVVGVATFNRPDDVAPAEALIRARAKPSPRALLDPTVPLWDLVPR